MELSQSRRECSEVKTENVRQPFLLNRKEGCQRQRKKDVSPRRQQWEARAQANSRDSGVCITYRKEAKWHRGGKRPRSVNGDGGEFKGCMKRIVGRESKEVVGGLSGEGTNEEGQGRTLRQGQKKNRGKKKEPAKELAAVMTGGPVQTPGAYTTTRSSRRSRC